jgi:GWxTD domain-containing protein
MNLPAEWFQAPVFQGLGWALVHFLWQGALITLVAAGVLYLCRSARMRYGVACSAMVAMFAAFVATFVLSIPGKRMAGRLDWMMAASSGLRGTAGAGESAGVLMDRIQPFLPWIVGFWLTGALVFGVYRLGGWMAAQRMRRVAGAVPFPWQKRLNELAQRIGVSRTVILLQSSMAEVPFLIGVLRPAILLPAGLLTGLPPEQLEAILLHELSHIRRWDYLTNLLQTVVESALFYHPAVWWISRLIRSERELCCDDMVVAAQNDARSYASALVRLEELRRVRREPALAATGGELMKRIRRLLQSSEEPRTATPIAVSLAIAAGMACVLAGAQQTTPQTPYGKWLNEDAVYIIAAEERAAFERLTTDPERSEFIRQFWLRRDPTPGTPANEFKEEHYRRIAYANQRFASSVPGWTTDRGRLYILYGPPDEIENHPDAQDWRYRRIEGIGADVFFRFTDPKRSGDYRLAGPPKVKEPARK